MSASTARGFPVYCVFGHVPLICVFPDSPRCLVSS
jgi:hypothetical protein